MSRSVAPNSVAPNAPDRESSATTPESTTIVPNSDVAAPELSLNKRSAYLAQLFKTNASVSFRPEVNQAMAQLQQQAASHLPELSFPSTKDEDWRFTDLSPLLETTFQSPTPCFPLATPSELKPLLLPEVTHRLVFVNGAYDADLSQLPDLPQGVTIGNFKTLQDERILSYLTQQPGAEEVFTTLNTSCFEDLAVIWLDPNVVLSQPLHLLFISNCGQTPIFCQPRCLVVVQAHSSLSLIEDYATLGPGAPQGLGQRTYFNNGVTEFWLGENAQVHHSRIQREAQQAFHIGKTTVSQSRHSRYTNLAIHGGSRLSRHNLEVFHQGEGVETRLHGLALVTGQQLADTHSTICYSHPQGRSDQLYKAIADDRGRSVFNGRVVVPQAAQLTDAQQLNRNLLLSPRARVDTKPQLEIVADNVKCTHGATVSQLEDDEIFYLQSRGLDRTTAQNLLIDGFAAEIIQQLPVASLQSQLTQMVEQRTKT